MLQLHPLVYRNDRGARFRSPSIHILFPSLPFLPTLVPSIHSHQPPTRSPVPSIPCLFPLSMSLHMQLGGLVSAVISPSGPGRSPAVKRFWCIFGLKSAHLLSIIATLEFIYSETFVILLYILAVYNGDKGWTRCLHAKIDCLKKYQFLWGGGHLGASPPQLFDNGAIASWSRRLCRGQQEFEEWSSVF